MTGLKIGGKIILKARVYIDVTIGASGKQVQTTVRDRSSWASQESAAAWNCGPCAQTRVISPDINIYCTIGARRKDHEVAKIRCSWTSQKKIDVPRICKPSSAPNTRDKETFKYCASGIV